MWKNTVEQDRPQNTIPRMRFTCSTTKITVTRSEYVTLIAFPSQHRLIEGASVERHTYIVCHVTF